MSKRTSRSARRAGTAEPAPTRAKASEFDAASTTIHRIKNWNPGNSDMTSMIVGDGDKARARARKLVRENPWAVSGVRTAVSNAIGSGIVPRSLHPDPAMRRRINGTFERWTKVSSPDGKLDFYGQQTQICRAIRTDGEGFARLRYRGPADPIEVKLQIQLFEADHCPYHVNDTTPNNFTRAGVVFNKLGQIEAYMITRDHPGSIYATDVTPMRVPADQILHCFEQLRPEQIRGMPWLTPAIIKLYDIAQLTDATLLRAKVANLLSVWIKRGANSNGLLNETDKGDGTADAQFEPGSVSYLQPDEEPIFCDPPAPGIGFDAFLNAMLRAVAAAMGVTFEQLTGDLSHLNYSSIRAGLLEFRRYTESFQHQVIIHQFCRPVWDAWIRQALLSGALGPDAASSYNKDPNGFVAVRWDTPGWPWVDPLKDVMAAKAAVRAGFTTRARVVAGQGENVEEVDDEQAADNARADALGLSYDSDARYAENEGIKSAAMATLEMDNEGAGAKPKREDD